MRKLYFKNAEEGFGKILDMYRYDNDVTGGAFADCLVGEFEKYFDESQDIYIAMIAIQKFRSYDWEEIEDEQPQMYADIDMVFDETLNLFINDYQDYQFRGTNNNYFVPSGVRVGYYTDETCSEYVLDEGVCYSANYRAAEFKEDALLIENWRLDDE